jgi:hypothetical protein
LITIPGRICVAEIIFEPVPWLLWIGSYRQTFSLAEARLRPRGVAILEQAVLSIIKSDRMRTTKTVSISMTPAELEEAEQLARETNRSLSGLLREGLKRLKTDQYWANVHAFARPRAFALNITEDDVVRLVHEYRGEKRRRPSKKTNE